MSWYASKTPFILNVQEVRNLGCPVLLNFLYGDVTAALLYPMEEFWLLDVSLNKDIAPSFRLSTSSCLGSIQICTVCNDSPFPDRMGMRELPSSLFENLRENTSFKEKVWVWCVLPLPNVPPSRPNSLLTSPHFLSIQHFPTHFYPFQ